MIRKIIKKIGNKTFIINIPVIDINDFYTDSSGFFEQAMVEIFMTTEDNLSRITEDGLYIILE
jgi:hypothetical protein